MGFQQNSRKKKEMKKNLKIKLLIQNNVGNVKSVSKKIGIG